MFSPKRKTGNQAEALALKYLQQHGLQLIERNYLTQLGEVDIIMLDKSSQTLVFIEVRYRKHPNLVRAVDTVTLSKQQKVVRSATHYLQTHANYAQYPCRFDVVGLESDLKYPNITWIKNAFDA